MIVRREAGHLRRYVHLGTGNYNETTSRLYTDVSYLTCKPEYGNDSSLFFNAVPVAPSCCVSSASSPPPRR
jgi:polyphosphate kinase